MTPGIPGADSLVAFFGEWPSFHDAEIMTLHIDRERRASFLRIRVFTFSDQTDSRGVFIRERDALVVFEFTGIRSVRIEGEDADVQNVISSLIVEQVDDGYRLLVGPCYGMAGEIVVKDLKVRLESSTPDS
jgi:Immunity protein 50